MAILAADALIDGKLLTTEQFDAAKEIVAEEIWVRLLMNDFPPRIGAPRDQGDSS